MSNNKGGISIKGELRHCEERSSLKRLPACLAGRLYKQKQIRNDEGIGATRNDYYYEVKSIIFGFLKNKI